MRRRSIKEGKKKEKEDKTTRTFLKNPALSTASSSVSVEASRTSRRSLWRGVGRGVGEVVS